ncbi:MAG: DNA methylase [Candidatus Omnitrophota bacterium]|jgi:hypothetical protein|nr:MAG: DNA methylase [Candidatus Omnitrophota bacterium]
MAESPSHKFGQLIGNLLEAVVEPYLSEFAMKNNLYLDHQRNSREARKGKKVTWEDHYGNIHDLDFVIERNGTDEVMGTPVAFIEVAWRRYTKHSRNKAQEIQGTILPLAERFKWSNPFLGVVLSGVFTEGSLEQLRSHGFCILYFPYATLVSAFASAGIRVAFDETTQDVKFLKCVREIESISHAKMKKIMDHLIHANKDHLREFMAALEKRLERMVQRIVVIPLYGSANEFNSIEEAIGFLDHHTITYKSNKFRKYEILVTFTNGDHVEGSFKEKEKAIEFLQFVAKQ